MQTEFIIRQTGKGSQAPHNGRHAETEHGFRLESNAASSVDEQETARRMQPNTDIVIALGPTSITICEIFRFKS